MKKPRQHLLDGAIWAHLSRCIAPCNVAISRAWETNGDSPRDTPFPFACAIGGAFITHQRAPRKRFFITS